MNNHGTELDPRLPVGPLRGWIERRIARYPDRSGGMSGISPNQVGQFAADLARHAPARDEDGWARFVFRMRKESATVQESDADMILCAIDDGTFLWDLWPDRDAAILEARRLRNPQLREEAMV